jgi:hypothetical protein
VLSLYSTYRRLSETPEETTHEIRRKRKKDFRSLLPQELSFIWDTKLCRQGDQQFCSFFDKGLTHPPTHARTRARAHTHKDTSKTRPLSPRVIWFWGLASRNPQAIYHIKGESLFVAFLFTLLLTLRRQGFGTLQSVKWLDCGLGDLAASSRDKRFFSSLFLCIQNSCGAHRAPSSVDTWSKVSGRSITMSTDFHRQRRLRMRGAIPTLLSRLHVKHRDNFTRLASLTHFLM